MASEDTIAEIIQISALMFWIELVCLVCVGLDHVVMRLI
jgi:hypothetical protein